MKVLFVGLGSIGTRHLRNLAAICRENGEALHADALRSSSRVLAQDVKAMLKTEYISIDEISGVYDAAFITNPTNLHFEALCSLKGLAKSLFIEKPIFESSNYSLEQCIAPQQSAYIAAPMRFCKTYMVLKELLPTLRVYSARVICSSYLPDWRKGVDYRKVYSAKKEMGGGVTIDLIHEWDYLVDLFGFPIESYNFKGQYSHLEINSDDVSVYIAKYEKLLCEVHLDYFGRGYRRTIELLCENGSIIADFGEGTVRLENGEIIDCSEDVNERYLREMRYFIGYMRKGGESINSPEKALKVLKLTLNE